MKYRSRKFIIAASSLVVGSIALFTGHLTGSEWVSAIGLILTLYGTADVAHQKLNGVEK